MTIRLFLVIVFFVAFAIVSYAHASPVSVPLDHWFYHFIERFQAKGVLGDSLSNIRPYSRDEIADIIIRIWDLSKNGDIKLSGVEKDQLDTMKRELAPEITARGAAGVNEYGHLLDWEDDEKKLVVEAGYAQQTTLKRGTEDHNIYLSTLQIIWRGNLGDDLFFYSDNRASYENSSEPLPLWRPYLDETRYPWNAVSDSYLILHFPWADIQLGKDEVLWGPGYHGVIGLSGLDPTFYTVKLPFEVWKIRFVGMLGFLRDDLTKSYGSGLDKKYLAAHRIEITPFPGLCIGWQEVYLYAESFRVELLNPITLYQMAEDYFGDIGNNTMEGDIELCILPHTKLYASIFLDDFHPYENFLTYTPNRWSALGGILVADPFGIKNLDLRAEYARVEPWTYPHKGITQEPPVPLSYKHFDTSLGHWIGPNADDLFFELNHQFSAGLLARLSYNRIRKGEVGGSLYDYFTLADLEKGFLAGIVEKERTISLGLVYRMFQNSSIEFSYSYVQVNNKQKEEAKLPGSDPRKQPWESVQNWEQDVFQAAITLRY